MNRVVMPLGLFRQLMRQLLDRPETPIMVPVGVDRHAGNLELLAVPPPGETGSRLYMALSREMVPPVALSPDILGVLLLGDGPRRGQAVGFVGQGHERREPLSRLRLVGAGMHEIPLGEPERAPHHSFVSLETLLAGAETRERWSRTIGALGAEAWERWRGLHYGIIGVGRTGSVMALALARCGARRLTLIDADRVEVGNLGEMQGVTSADVGEYKVTAVSNALHALCLPQLAVTPVANSITRHGTLDAARACDVLIGCVDHDGARLAANVLATLYHRPLIDIATGVQGDGTGQRMGTDVRLLLPGRCLLCYGGLRDEAAARRILAGADHEDAFYAGREWQRERAGSLASLNQLAVSVALRLCEDLVAEHVGESLWTHLEYDAGRLAVTYPSPAFRTGACPLCRLSGHGDAGLTRAVDLLQTQSRVAFEGAN